MRDCSIPILQYHCSKLGVRHVRTYWRRIEVKVNVDVRIRYAIRCCSTYFDPIFFWHVCLSVLNF